MSGVAPAGPSMRERRVAIRLCATLSLGLGALGLVVTLAAVLGGLAPGMSLHDFKSPIGVAAIVLGFGAGLAAVLTVLAGWKGARSGRLREAEPLLYPLVGAVALSTAAGVCTLAVARWAAPQVPKLVGLRIDELALGLVVAGVPWAGVFGGSVLRGLAPRERLGWNSEGATLTVLLAKIAGGVGLASSVVFLGIHWSDLLRHVSSRAIVLSGLVFVAGPIAMLMAGARLAGVRAKTATLGHPDFGRVYRSLTLRHALGLAALGAGWASVAGAAELWSIRRAVADAPDDPSGPWWFADGARAVFPLAFVAPIIPAIVLGVIYLTTPVRRRGNA